MCLECIAAHELTRPSKRRHPECSRTLTERYLPDWRRRDALDAAPLAHEDCTH